MSSPNRLRKLLPSSTWACVALLLLVLFALLRSVLWASVQPGWLAPDEDYHWLYINYMVEKHTVPSLNKPVYTAELFKAVQLTQQGVYLSGARTNYGGSPHAVLKKLGGPLSEREPAPPRPRPVLHPPGYYLGGALIDDALWHKVSVTRLTAIRYYSALLGALTIFFAWLLAAQVLAREWQRLAAAALTATQPILAFSASTITNDVGVAVTFTATLACCAWMLRGPPRARQGIPLGVLLSAALFTKATNYSLVIVIAAMLWLMWRTYSDRHRDVLGIAGWTAGVTAVLVGWWYIRLLIVTHSILGEEGNLTGGGTHGPGILHAPALIWQWFSQVYRSYWFDYLSYEVHANSVWFWLPLIAIAILLAGFVVLVRRLAGTLTVPEAPRLRQVTVLALTPIILLLPPLALDILRGARGLPFTSIQGRYLTPAYPALAVIAVLVVCELTARVPRARAAIVGATVLGAFVFYWHTWITWVLERFYGPIAGHWGRELFHATWDKPTFITETSLAVLLLAAPAAFLAAYVVTAVGTAREAARRATPGPATTREPAATV